MKAKSKKTKMPLTMATPGRDVRLVDVTAGRGLRRRLADMGLVPGAVFRVMSRDCAGPFVLAVKETRIVLGRGMAHKIIIE